MSLATLTPQEAFERLNNDPAVTYVDVRTVAEFARGHPKGKAIKSSGVRVHNMDEF